MDNLTLELTEKIKCDLDTTQTCLPEDFTNIYVGLSMLVFVMFLTHGVVLIGLVTLVNVSCLYEVDTDTSVRGPYRPLVVRNTHDTGSEGPKEGKAGWGSRV